MLGPLGEPLKDLQLPVREFGKAVGHGRAQGRKELPIQPGQLLVRQRVAVQVVVELVLLQVRLVPAKHRQHLGVPGVAALAQAGFTPAGAGSLQLANRAVYGHDQSGHVQQPAQRGKLFGRSQFSQDSRQHCPAADVGKRPVRQPGLQQNPAHEVGEGHHARGDGGAAGAFFEQPARGCRRQFVGGQKQTGRLAAGGQAAINLQRRCGLAGARRAVQHHHAGLAAEDRIGQLTTM